MEVRNSEIENQAGLVIYGFLSPGEKRPHELKDLLTRRPTEINQISGTHMNSTHVGIDSNESKIKTSRNEIITTARFSEPFFLIQNISWTQSYLLAESVSGLTRDRSCPETSWQSASGRRRSRRRERRTILTIVRWGVQWIMLIMINTLYRQIPQ